jgi:hypothetical protein
MSTRVMEHEAGKNSARGRVKNGCFFSQEVGKQYDAIRAWRNGLGFAIALVFPLRQRALYKSSSASISIGRVPILPIAAVLSIIVVLALAYVVLFYPELGITNSFGLPGPLSGLIYMAALVVLGLLIYFIARAVRKAQGIDLSLIYRELPPE